MQMVLTGQPISAQAALAAESRSKWRAESAPLAP